MKRISDSFLAILAISAAGALVLLAKQCVILKMYALSQWPDLTFYGTLGLQPGVALPVLGSVLTAFCKFPVVGVLLILLSMAGLTAAVRKLTGPSLWALVPALCLFLFISGMDYSIYTMRAPGVLFSQTIGLTCSVLLIAGWKKISGKKSLWQILYISAAILVGYPVIGAFAVLALFGILMDAALRKDWTGAVFSAVAGAAVPYLFTALVFTHIDTRYTLCSALPYMDFVGNHIKLVPLAAGMLSVIVLPALPPKALNNRGILFSLIFGAAALAAVILLSYRDRNFHLELKMEQAIERHDWDGVLKYASLTDTPTRVIVMYRNIALAAEGQLCDRMFTFSHETVPLNTSAQISQTEVCAAPVFFWNGQLNFSTRWAWEMSMMFQRTIERYKYQAKVALFKGEDNPRLVEKYLQIIERNPFERKWAARYRHYLNDRQALSTDEEYRLIMPLNDFKEIKYISSAVVENTLLHHYVLQEEPGGPMLSQALASAMMMKDVDMFRYFFDLLLKEGGRIPNHVGEAALLFAYMTRDQSVIDRTAGYLGGPQAPVVQRFIRFTTDASNIRDAASAKERFREKYGNTYWYYCYFIQSLTTD